MDIGLSANLCLNGRQKVIICIFTKYFYAAHLEFLSTFLHEIYFPNLSIVGNIQQFLSQFFQFHNIFRYCTWTSGVTLIGNASATV